MVESDLSYVNFKSGVSKIQAMGQNRSDKGTNAACGMNLGIFVKPL